MDALIEMVPKVKDPLPIVCLILNIFSGGIGTCVAAIMPEDGNLDVKNLVFGILQIILTYFFVGWVWGVVWGIAIYMKASK